MANRHLVIVGGGHAHVHVLRQFARRPEPDVRLTIISPTPVATYTGMVPGVLAGQYRPEDAQIDVAALVGRAGGRFVQDRVCRINAMQRRLTLERQEPVDYDVLSLDIGAQPAAADRVAADAPVVWVKPIEVALERVAQLLQSAPTGARVVVVGAGAGGVEISFAIRARLRHDNRASITLCGQTRDPMPERGARTSRLVRAALAAYGVSFFGDVEVERADAAGVRLNDGRLLAADLIVWSTGAAAPPLFATSALPTDPKGFLRVDRSLRCVDHPNIFAAGDCIALAGYPDLPKAGVFAVRQGPVLATNLRLVLRRVSRLQVYAPQHRFLSLLNTGDGRAILSYGPLAAHTRWAWWLKDRIDRRFIAQYRLEGAAPSTPPDALRQS